MGPTAGPVVLRTPPITRRDRTQIGANHSNSVRRPSLSTRGTAARSMTMLTTLDHVSIGLKTAINGLLGGNCAVEWVGEASHVEEVTGVGADDWHADRCLPMPWQKRDNQPPLSSGLVMIITKSLGHLPYWCCGRLPNMSLLVVELPSKKLSRSL